MLACSTAFCARPAANTSLSTCTERVQAPGRVRCQLRGDSYGLVHRWERRVSRLPENCDARRRLITYRGPSGCAEAGRLAPGSRQIPLVRPATGRPVEAAGIFARPSSSPASLQPGWPLRPRPGRFGTHGSHGAAVRRFISNSVREHHLFGVHSGFTTGTVPQFSHLGARAPGQSRHASGREGKATNPVATPSSHPARDVVSPPACLDTAS